MSENQNELKEQIRAWMKKQNMNRKEFAAKCLVAPNTVRNWLAKANIPKDKEALIRLMMEKTEEIEKLKEAERSNWKPFAVMMSAKDYEMIKKAAELEHKTVEEWSETILIEDAHRRMRKAYDAEGNFRDATPRAAEEADSYGSSGSSSSIPNSSSGSPSAGEPDAPQRKPRK